MGIVGPPLTVDAEVLLAERRGQSRALHVSARGERGPVDCIIKIDARLKAPPTEHLREWLACVLGQHLGLHTATPYEVRVSDEFAKSVTDTAVRNDLMRSIGSVFGCSVFVGGTHWVPTERLPLDLLQPASELLAFDVYIHNVDRRRDNPNLVTMRDRVAAYDHGDAFAFIFPLLGAADPAEDPLREVVERHAFWLPLRGRPLALDRFYGAMEALSDEFLDEVVEATPAAWQKGLADGKLPQIVELLKKRRDKVRSWLPKVEQWIRA